MRIIIPLVSLILLLHAPDVRAAGAEARDIARLNNCSPKKVEVYQQKVGSGSQTIYRVECIAPKTVDEKAPKMATAMLVQCDGSLCEMLRPIYDASN